MSELKPCPFCGTKEGLNNLLVGRFAREIWSVGCFSVRCGCEGPLRKTKSGAIQAWNRRHKDASA